MLFLSKEHLCARVINILLFTSAERYCRRRIRGKILIVLKANKMASIAESHKCLIHFKEVKGPLTCFTEISFGKFLTNHALWLTLDGEQRDVAERTKDLVEQFQTYNEPLHLDTLYYHRCCYSKFTNLTLVKRAQNRCSKKLESPAEVHKACQESNVENLAPSKKLLRSSTPRTEKPRSQAILPPVCIVCNKGEIYITDTVRKKKNSSIRFANTKSNVTIYAIF